MHIKFEGYNFLNDESCSIQACKTPRKWLIGYLNVNKMHRINLECTPYLLLSPFSLHWQKLIYYIHAFIFKICFHFQNMLSFTKYAFIFKIWFHSRNVLSFSKCPFRLFECQQNAPNQFRMHTLSSPEPIFFKLAKIDILHTRNQALRVLEFQILNPSENFWEIALWQLSNKHWQCVTKWHFFPLPIAEKYHS